MTKGVDIKKMNDFGGGVRGGGLTAVFKFLFAYPAFYMDNEESTMDTAL